MCILLFIPFVYGNPNLVSSIIDHNVTFNISNETPLSLFLLPKRYNDDHNKIKTKGGFNSVNIDMLNGTAQIFIIKIQEIFGILLKQGR